MNLNSFFNPKSVAVIGASSDKNKVGFAIMSNLLCGIKRDVYPVSISEKEILGLKVYSSIKEIETDRSIDLAIIAIRADIVPQILNECGQRGIKNVIVISAGFKEIGESGKILEDEIRKISDKYGIALLGPNCLGIMDIQAEFNATFGAQKPNKGNIAFLSQSGALGTSILDLAMKEGIGFSKFISLGNEAKLSEIEFLEYLAEDDSTKAILIYLEKLSNSRKFMELAKKISKVKPIVVLKAGRSKRGMQAVMSHTGSLAPEDSVFSAALAQSGVIAVESIREFFNMAKLFQLGIIKPLRKIAIVTNGGGPSVVASDLVELSNSLSLSDLSEETKESLKKVLPSMAAVGNPVDIIGDALSSRYEEALKLVIAEKNVEVIILMLTPQMMTEVEKTARLVVQYGQKKPIIPVFLGGPAIQVGLEFLKQTGLINFNFPKDAVEALDRLALGLLKKEEDPVHFKIKDRNSISPKMMSFSDTNRLLSDYGISISGSLVSERSSLEKVISVLDKGPFAMKLISADVVHKTDAGAVSLNIKDFEEAIDVWDSMKKKILNIDPNAQIEGILVQKMISGREVIIGMKRDKTFGPTILFGLGGIMAEAMKDTILRIAPIDREEALKMMQEIKGIKILKGMRGQESVDFDALAEILVSLSRLSMEHPEIQEIDLNPVMANESTAVVVDARIMI